MAEVILCPKLRHGRNLASVSLAEILAFGALSLHIRNVRHWGPHNRREPWQGHGWNPLKMPRDPAEQSQLLWSPAVSATATSIRLPLCEGVWARPNYLGPSQIPHRDEEIIKWKLRVLPLTEENTTHGVLVTILKKKFSSYYHLWNNQPLPCSFNSEVLLNNFFYFLVSFSTLPSFIPLGLPQYRCGFLSLPLICIIVNSAVQCIVAVIRAFPTPNNIFISAPLVSSRKFRSALNV